MNIVKVNPLEKKHWNDLITESGQHSIFYTREWARVLIDSYGYAPHYLCLIENNKFSLFIPLLDVKSFITGRRAVSLPFSDFCDPIVNKEIDIERLMEFVDDYSKELGWKYVDFHGGANLFENRSPSSEYYGHKLELNEDLNETFSAFRSSTRRNIKKAVRSKVKIDYSNSSENWHHFYRLHCATRKRHMVPPQPYKFFNNIFHELIKKNLGALFCASYQGRIFAAAVFFHFGDKVIYKFGASDYRYQYLRGNNLLIWEAIKWYSHRGYNSIEFGRTDIHHDGLRRFKTGWGGTEYLMKYFRYDLEQKQFVRTNHGQRNSIMKSVFRILPVGISKLLGGTLYRHFA